MKPVKRTKRVVIEYWGCGIKTHRHKTESVAQKCIDKQSRSRPHVTPQEHADRQKQIILDVLNGMTFAEAARKHNRSSSRISGILNKSLRQLRRSHGFMMYREGGDLYYGDAKSIYRNRDQLKPLILEMLDRAIISL